MADQLSLVVVVMSRLRILSWWGDVFTPARIIRDIGTG